MVAFPFTWTVIRRVLTVRDVSSLQGLRPSMRDYNQLSLTLRAKLRLYYLAARVLNHFRSSKATSLRLSIIIGFAPILIPWKGICSLRTNVTNDDVRYLLFRNLLSYDMQHTIYLSSCGLLDWTRGSRTNLHWPFTTNLLIRSCLQSSNESTYLSSLTHAVGFKPTIVGCYPCAHRLALRTTVQLHV
jgi:hypothetical protein